MKISTKGRYGLRAMIYIASHATDDNCVSLKSIAQAEGISDNYLEQLIAQLKKYKLVKSVRGANGGYTLAKQPVEISVGEILRALEGSLAPVECINGGANDCQCGANCTDECSSKDVWQKIYDSVSETVDNITLESLISENN